ncbi:MAG: GntR family transcriptional regulator [Rubrivivax sp.]
MSGHLLRLETAPDLVERAYQALADAICSGALAPGERLTQDALAERLAVSRQPVLQALRLLKADGLVEDAPGRGLQVTSLAADHIAQVYAVRCALDALAATLAAERRAELPSALLRAGRTATEAGDVAQMIETDIAFHQALYAASGNPLIERSAAPHWRQIRRVMGAVLLRGATRRPVWDEHDAIARAVAAGDAATAARLAREHGAHASAALGSALAPLPVAQPGDPR